MKKLKKLVSALKEKGFKYVLKRVFSGPSVGNYALVKSLFKGKSGIEIGGPSALFTKESNFIPIYNLVESLDGCNFSSNTLWEGKISAGKTFKYYKNKTGEQYICEASDLAGIPSAKYDFLLSSNCLEHVANPLKAVKEWNRVLKPSGIMLLILPNKDYCFDHNRPITLFSHLLDDLKNNTQETDLTHLDEILALHDLSMDLPAGTPEQFKARSLKNFENRALHHHVFDIPLLKQIYNYMGLDILMTHESYMNIIVGRKKTI